MEIEEQSNSNPKDVVTFDEENNQSNADDGFDDDNDEFNAEKEQSILCLKGDISNLSNSLMGLKREKVEDIYDLYCSHALEVGFSVRKSSTRYDSAGIVREKYFVCSCEGSKRDTTSSSSIQEKGKKRTTNVTRTNCKASLRVKLNKDGLYEIVNHNTIHNHILLRREWTHMHRSQRSINMNSFGMRARAVDSFVHTTHDAEGEDVLDHTMKDHLDFVYRMEISALEGGDAQTLFDNLCQQGIEDQEFFFRVKLDGDGRLCNVFWRDSTMKEDYNVYGDVVVFDTTYRTNKYNLICVSFVGINNHWKNVMFGCAFMTNEKTESFEWLFEVFKKSMEGQSPVTLFTDEDLAIENAIEKIFPASRHRLCLWHLYQSAVNRFHKLKSDKCFSEAFQKCLTGCTNREEFEDCWSSLISDYGLQDESWFKRLYDLRQKWCTAYNKDFFSPGIGILSSHRSDITNSAIEFNAKKTANLNDLYTIFKRTIKRWRSNEVDDEFQCSRGKPISCLPLTGIFRHASEVYTLTIFEDFEKEFLNSIATSCNLLSEADGTKIYNVIHPDGITSYQVNFYVVDFLVNCSCKRFEECGLLCCHCLRVLHVHSVPQIPDCYIKKRWTKFAKKDLWDKSENGQSEKSKNCTPWRHETVRKFYNLVRKAQENEEARTVIEDGLNSTTAAVEALITTGQTGEDTVVPSLFVDVLHPSPSITKGRKHRIEELLQKIKKKKTSDASNSNQ